MSAEDLLLEVLDNLGDDDFQTFKWYLSRNVLDGCKHIPRSYLDDAVRTKTVTKLTESYGDATAVAISVKVLRKMNHNAAAQKLEKEYRESGGGTAASSTTGSSAAAAAAPAAAAPMTITANSGGVVFVPNVSGTKGAWNVTINKS